MCILHVKQDICKQGNASGFMAESPDPFPPSWWWRSPPATSYPDFKQKLISWLMVTLFPCNLLFSSTCPKSLSKSKQVLTNYNKYKRFRILLYALLWWTRTDLYIWPLWVIKQWLLFLMFSWILGTAFFFIKKSGYTYQQEISIAIYTFETPLA